MSETVRPPMHIMNNDRRDIKKDKKIIARALRIVFIALGILVLLTAVLYVAELLLSGDPVDLTSKEEGIYFFPADYSANIFEDDYYMALDRRIMFTSYGITEELDGSDNESFGAAANMFYGYFTAIIEGDYEEYPSYFTESGLKNIVIPERFTMQKIYDIDISLFSASASGDTTVEVYQVSYRILENNGTFRGDISSGATRTLVFEVYVSGKEALINSIGFRTDSDRVTSE